MNIMLIGYMFLIFGLIFLFISLFKYTEEEHQKRLKKYPWMQGDEFFLEVESNITLVFIVISKSYSITKMVLILLSLIPITIGVCTLRGFLNV
jgi:hypothetical protein